jgi:hypothetical protein
MVSIFWDGLLLLRLHTCSGANTPGVSHSDLIETLLQCPACTAIQVQSHFVTLPSALQHLHAWEGVLLLKNF